MKPDAMASGSHAGCGRTKVKHMSFTLRVSPSRANTGARRPTGSTPRCCCAWQGLAAWRARTLRDGMVAVPTIEEEDAKRPHRERETLAGEKTGVVNRMKAALIRLGIRGFKPELRRAPGKLEWSEDARRRSRSHQIRSMKSAAIWPARRWCGSKSA